MRETEGVSRRGFGRAIVAGAAGMVVGAPVGAGGDPVDPVLRDATLRGLALSADRGDPVSARLAAEAMARLEAVDTEGWLLARIYRVLDVRPAGEYWRVHPQAEAGDLALVHGAVLESLPVTFRYLDREGNETRRTVLPLVIVHPPQGVKLLAWCALRQEYRQFFVREMRDLSMGSETFAPKRLGLLQGLVEKEGA